MKIIEINNKEQLNNFVRAQKYSQLLQSWEWGEFQQAVGNKITRLGMEDGEQLVAAATLIKKPLPLGKGYFYCPRGPVVNLEMRSKKLEVINFLFSEVEKIVKDEKAIFLRLEPQFKIQSRIAPRDKIHKTIDIQPSKTLILNLAETEDALLKKMHQKTRYNIRLAKRRGVKITEAGPERFNEFWQLMCETVNRDGFRLHGKEYYEEMKKCSAIKLYFAEYNNKVIVANVISFCGDTVTYMHGASSNEYRNVMAPYLLQWQVIKLARETGYKYYDFFGIDEIKWPGVTRFKKGFGGEEVKYPGTFDLVYNKPWYTIYKFVRKVRRAI